MRPIKSLTNPHFLALSMTVALISAAATCAFASSEEAQKLVDQASHLNETANYQQSIEKLLKAVALAPGYPLALESLSYTYDKRGQQVDLNPPVALDYFDEAAFYDTKNKLKSDDADNMMRMLGKNPAIAADHIYFGDVAMAQKHFRVAVVEYEKALKLESAGTESSGTMEKLQAALKLSGAKPIADKAVNFDNYMVALRLKIKSNWHPPRTILGNKLKVHFVLDRQGNVHELYLEATSDNILLDKSAIQAIELSDPFAPLPAGAPEYANIDFGFDFNNHQAEIAGTLNALTAQQQAAYAKQSIISSLRKEIKAIKDAGKLEYVDDQGHAARTQTNRLCLKLASYLYVLDKKDEALEILETSRILQEKHSNEYTAEYPQTLLFISEIYINKEQTEDAKSLIERVIQLCEANPELGTTNLIRAYTLFGSCGRGSIYTFKADALQHQQQPDLLRLNQVIKENPKEATLYFMRGVAHNRRKEWGQAVDDYTEAIKLNDKYAYAYMLRAQTLRLEKKDAEALADLDKAISLDSNLAMAYSNRGTIYSDTGKLEQALPDFAQAIKLTPEQALNFCNRGVVYYRLKKYPEALSDFNEALKLKSTYALALANRSCVDWQLGNFNDTVEDASQAIALNKKLANAWCNRGKGYFSLHILDKALQDLSKSINLDPMMLKGEAYYFRAQVYEQMGKGEAAAADRKTAEGLHFEPM